VLDLLAYLESAGNEKARGVHCQVARLLAKRGQPEQDLEIFEGSDDRMLFADGSSAEKLAADAAGCTKSGGTIAGG
jgi:hypothetical protein